MKAILAYRRPGRRACRHTGAVTSDLHKYAKEIGARVKGVGVSLCVWRSYESMKVNFEKPANLL